MGGGTDGPVSRPSDVIPVEQFLDGVGPRCGRPEALFLHGISEFVVLNVFPCMFHQLQEACFFEPVFWLTEFF